MAEFSEKQILETGRELSQLVLDSTVNDKSGTSLLHEYIQMFSDDSGTYAKQREAEEKSIESLNEIQEVTKRLKEGSMQIGEMEKTFDKFGEEIEALKESHSRLNAEIDNLRETLNIIIEQVSSIQNVSKQTNLLAINASIEAARAGSAGIGFRIIANEVKRLSETSDKNSEEIEENIKVFAEKLNTLVNENSNSAKALDALKKTTEETGSMLQSIGKQSADNANLAQTEIDRITECNNFLIEVTKETEQESIEKIKKISDNAASNIYQINDRVSLILELKSIFDNLLSSVSERMSVKSES